MIKDFIFARLLLIEDYGKRTLQKEVLIVPTAERFKATTLRKSYW